jgi:hypothetical protein
LVLSQKPIAKGQEPSSHTYPVCFICCLQTADGSTLSVTLTVGRRRLRGCWPFGASRLRSGIPSIANRLSSPICDGSPLPLPARTCTYIKRKFEGESIEWKNLKSYQTCKAGYRVPKSCLTTVGWMLHVRRQRGGWRSLSILPSKNGES